MIHGKFRKYERHLSCKFAQGNLSFEMCCCLTVCLTGLPPESRGPMSEDMSNRLSEVHEGARKVMKDVHQALWPEVTPVPEDMAALAERLKRARRRIQAWKVSACREGAREAWAMVKTHYTGLRTT